MSGSRNWADLSVSAISPTRGSKLHKKLSSPERKKRSPSEAARIAEERQARAAQARERVEKEKIKKARAHTERVAAHREQEAARVAESRERAQAKQAKAAALREEALAAKVRKAQAEDTKVKENALVRNLSEAASRVELKQKLSREEARKAELKAKAKQESAAKRAAQEAKRAAAAASSGPPRPLLCRLCSVRLPHPLPKKTLDAHLKSKTHALRAVSLARTDPDVVATPIVEAAMAISSPTADQREARAARTKTNRVALDDLATTLDETSIPLQLLTSGIHSSRNGPKGSAVSTTVTQLRRFVKRSQKPKQLLTSDDIEACLRASKRANTLFRSMDDTDGWHNMLTHDGLLFALTSVMACQGLPPSILASISATLYAGIQSSPVIRVAILASGAFSSLVSAAASLLANFLGPTELSTSAALLSSLSILLVARDDIGSVYPVSSPAELDGFRSILVQQIVYSEIPEWLVDGMMATGELTLASPMTDSVAFVFRALQVLIALVEIGRGSTTNTSDLMPIVMDALASCAAAPNVVTLLNSVLLQEKGLLVGGDSSSSSSSGKSGPASPSSAILSVFELGLRLLNTMAACDTESLQASLVDPAFLSPGEAFHMFTNMFVAVSPSHPPVACELIKLIGYVCAANPAAQEAVATGKHPTLLQRLVSLPVKFFTSSKFKAFVLPALIACVVDAPVSLAILKEDLSPVMLVRFLRKHRSVDAAAAPGGAGAPGGAAGAPSPLDRIDLDHAIAFLDESLDTTEQ